MKTTQEIAAIIAALKELYPDAACSLDYGKDYELLFPCGWRPSVPTPG